MRIKVTSEAVSGNVIIPPNDYWVSLNADAGEMTLSASGKDIRIKAMRRRANTKSKTTSITFYSAGARTWSLVISTPKQGEWLAYIDYDLREKKNK